MLAVIEIPWRHQTVARTSHEGALYAALDVIGGGNPALAQAIHDAKTPPPFSAYLADGLLRLGCLTTEVFLAVADSELAYKAVRIREDSFETILERARESAAGRAALRLEFLTPTVIARDSLPHLLPETALVFGSLIRRWRQCGGPEVPGLRYEETAVVGVRITDRRVALENHAQRGFTGRVAYRVPDDLGAWYHALADFADYAGVGRRTSQGFGRVTYERSAGRQPAGAGTVQRPDVRRDRPAQVPA